jgi:hypothetical protein
VLCFPRVEHDGLPADVSQDAGGGAPFGVPGVLRVRGHVSFTLSRYDMPRMGSDYDPRRQAEAAMKEAVRADGFERQRWIRLAQAWLEIARTRPDPYRSERSC